MKYWIDTEFLEDGRTIKLISIGVVAEDGREFYRETISGRYLANQTSWLRNNVLPHLASFGGIPNEAIARELVVFMGEKPEIWGYYAAYDWVVVAQLFGNMMDLPKGWPMLCLDVQQEAIRLGRELPPSPAEAHNALVDARWTRDAWKSLFGDGANGLG